MKEMFKKYLDNSQDCDTITLEVSNLLSFRRLFTDVGIIDEDVLYWTGDDSHGAEKDLFSLVREVWDIAYNHGYHDALAESGVTLAEMENE